MLRCGASIVKTTNAEGMHVIYAPLSDVRMSEVKVGPAHGVNGPTLSQLKDHLVRFALAHGRGWEGGGKRIASEGSCEVPNALGKDWKNRRIE